MKKTEARRKAMQIITMRNLNPNRLKLVKLIKDDLLIKDMMQIIPNSDLYYSTSSASVYAIINNKVVQIEVE